MRGRHERARQRDRFFRQWLAHRTVAATQTRFTVSRHATRRHTKMLYSSQLQFTTATVQRCSPLFRRSYRRCLKCALKSCHALLFQFYMLAPADKDDADDATPFFIVHTADTFL